MRETREWFSRRGFVRVSGAKCDYDVFTRDGRYYIVIWDKIGNPPACSRPIEITEDELNFYLSLPLAH